MSHNPEKPSLNRVSLSGDLHIETTRVFNTGWSMFVLATAILRCFATAIWCPSDRTVFFVPTQKGYPFHLGALVKWAMTGHAQQHKPKLVLFRSQHDDYCHRA